MQVVEPPPYSWPCIALLLLLCFPDPPASTFKIALVAKYVGIRLSSGKKRSAINKIRLDAPAHLSRSTPVVAGPLLVSSFTPTNLLLQQRSCSDETADAAATLVSFSEPAGRLDPEGSGGKRFGLRRDFRHPSPLIFSLKRRPP